MPPRGFTLIEVMLVLALLGLATAVVTLAWPADPQRALQRDAERVAAVLQAQRVLSRSTGQPRWWQVQGGAVVVFADGTAPGQPALRLLPEDARVRWRTPLEGQRQTLGPEPIVPPQALQLWREAPAGAEPAASPLQSLWVSTDGIRPFAVQQP